eukprot:jgi/Mesen1/9825/ME000007S09878
MLGLSYGEWAAILIAGVAAFGPKDIPIIAKTAGRLAGRAAGYLQHARSKFSNFAERTQINELHQELQETLAQVEAIRHELRSGVSLVNPGPLTRRALRAGGLDDLNAGSFEKLGDASPVELQHVSEGPVEGLAAGAHAATPSPLAALPGTLSPAAAAALAEAAAASAAGAAATGPLARANAPHLHAPPPKAAPVPPGQSPWMDPLAPAMAPFPRAQLTVSPAMSIGESQSQSQGSVTGGQGRRQPRPQPEALEGVLPISAVSAGLIPSQREGGGCGADILSDAIVERSVALDAMKFLGQHSAK